MLNRPNLRFEEPALIILNCNDSFITTTKKREDCMSVLVATFNHKGWTCSSALPFCTRFCHKETSPSCLKRNRGWGFPKSFLNFSRFDRRHSKCNLESMENAVTWNLHHQVAKQNGTRDVCIIPNKNKCLAAQPSHMQAQCVLQSNVQFCC